MQPTDLTPFNAPVIDIISCFKCPFDSVFSPTFQYSESSNLGTVSSPTYAKNKLELKLCFGIKGVFLQNLLEKVTLTSWSESVWDSGVETKGGHTISCAVDVWKYNFGPCTFFEVIATVENKVTKYFHGFEMCIHLHILAYCSSTFNLTPAFSASLTCTGALWNLDMFQIVIIQFNYIIFIISYDIQHIFLSV